MLMSMMLITTSYQHYLCLKASSGFFKDVGNQYALTNCIRNGYMCSDAVSLSSLFHRVVGSSSGSKSHSGSGSTSRSVMTITVASVITICIIMIIISINCHTYRYRRIDSMSYLFTSAQFHDFVFICT